MPDPSQMHVAAKEMTEHALPMISCNGEPQSSWDAISISTILYRYDATRRFTACHANQIPTGCTSSRAGSRLSHPAENIYESYGFIQILTIPTADFIGQTAASGSDSTGVPHDVNVYPQCAEWRFMVCRHRKP